MHAPLSSSADRLTRSRFSDWPLAVKSILGFWFFYALTIVARALLGSDPLTMLSNKMLTILAGIVLTGLVYAAIVLISGRGSVRKQAITAGLVSFLAGWGMAGLLISTENRMRESKEEHRLQAREGYIIIERGHTVRIERQAAEPLVLTWPRISDLDPYKRFRFAADTAVIWFFFFAAWSAFYLATKAQAEVLTAQRRAAEAESAAQAAQVRALRYQINPHFLFNTLNSLSSLVMAGRPEEAENMILKLSTFFRSSLSLDPSADVTLGQEIDLQRLYLDIEKIRFPERLRFEIDVPEDLANTPVPPLILQPLVENAIKYGVSATRDPVLLTISARHLDGGRIQIDVTNRLAEAGPTVPAAVPAHEGTGVGLANVCQRLEAHYGDRADCRFGPIPGGYQVSIALPIKDSDDD